jgi:hypothetical protein
LGEMHCSGRKTRKGLLRLQVIQTGSCLQQFHTISKPDGDIT